MLSFRNSEVRLDLELTRLAPSCRRTHLIDPASQRGRHRPEVGDLLSRTVSRRRLRHGKRTYGRPVHVDNVNLVGLHRLTERNLGRFPAITANARAPYPAQVEMTGRLAPSSNMHWCKRTSSDTGKSMCLAIIATVADIARHWPVPPIERSADTAFADRHPHQRLIQHDKRLACHRSGGAALLPGFTSKLPPQPAAKHVGALADKVRTFKLRHFPVAIIAPDRNRIRAFQQ